MEEAHLEIGEDLALQPVRHLRGGAQIGRLRLLDQRADHVHLPPGRDLSAEDLRLAAREIIPLATLYEEKVQALRVWGRTRARRASADRRMLDLLEG